MAIERRDALGRASTTHNMSSSSIYYKWANMRDRCNNPSCKQYVNYGGRGIKVCEEWNVFENFLNDMGVPEDGLSLDRIDVDGDYSKSNCRWADRKTQSNNRRNSKLYTHRFGVTLGSLELSILLGIKRATVQTRYRRGWSLDKQLNRGFGNVNS